MSTKRQFEEFEREARRLQKLWGVNDWKVFIRHEPTQTRTSIANCSPQSVKRVATLRLNSRKGAVELTDDPKEAARHEMVHVLLGEFSCIAGSRCVSSDEMEAAEEALVQRLMRLLPR